MLVYDQPVFCEGLRQVLRAMPGPVCCVECSSAAESLEVLRGSRIDIVITDLCLPSEREGLDLIESIRRTSDVPVLVVSGQSDSNCVISAIEMGASGFVPKRATLDEIRTATQAILQGRSYIHSLVAHCFVQRLRLPAKIEEAAPFALTGREQEVLEMLARGLSTREAGEQLYLSLSTIKTHLRALYRKFEVTNRTQLVLRAIQLRFVKGMEIEQT